MTHTPGPWAAHVATECIPDLPVDEWTYIGYSVFTDDGRGNGLLIDRSDANANLIAAAPDLLEALKFIEELSAEARQYAKVGTGEEVALRHIHNRAYKAISKATGEP